MRVLLFKFITLLIILQIEEIFPYAYGPAPCNYVPAPPGKTPPCAQPGQTYCEHPEQYPGERIQYLLKKWQYDHSSFLKDESKEEFSSYFYPPPIHKDGHYPATKSSYYPDPVHIPKHLYDDVRFGSTYIPPKVSSPYNFTHNLNSFAAYPDRPQYPQYQPQGQLLNFKYSSDIPPNSHQLDLIYGPVQSSYLPSVVLPPSPYLSKIWNRKDEGGYDKTLLLRRKRSELIKERLKYLNSFSRNSNSTLNRQRRQSLVGQPLCQTRANYIMPRAALNNKGNWMYVVNMPETNQMLTQLVKSEVCASQTCSGLCTVPVGSVARCEQKYVQKRLIALEGNGNDLYTDVFWFPSCCVCTISNN